MSHSTKMTNPIITSKISQAAIRQVLEGACQPDGDAKHPDLHIDPKFANVFTKDAPAKKTTEQISAEIAAVASISPFFTTVLDSVDIKRAGVNSDNSVRESIEGQNAGPEILSSASVRPVRGEDQGTPIPSRFASAMPGCESIVGRTLTTSDSLMENISKSSRNSIAAKSAVDAEYHNQKRARNNEDAQQPRRLGQRDDRTGLLIGSFGSSNQITNPDTNTVNDIEMFKGRMTNATNKMSPEGQKIAADLSKYFSGKVDSRHASRASWSEAAAQDMEQRLATASEKSKIIVADMRKQDSEKKVVDFTTVASVVHAPVPVVEDNRGDYLRDAVSRSEGIRKTASKKEEFSVAPVVRPRTSIADKLFEDFQPLVTEVK